MADPDDSSDFIEPASEDVSIHAQDFAVTSDYDPTINNESVVGSLTSSVYAHVFENGRRYHSYKQGRYPFPNDDREIGRESVRHALIQDILGGKLHLAPIGANPHHIVDVGTGYGDWAIEMGDRFPSAKVTGLDLSPMQSVWVPPNVEFVVEDVEDEWIHGSGLDYVHFRFVAVVLKNPLRVARFAFENLKPGGWIEFQELCPRPSCNDDTMPEDYAMKRFFRLVGDVCKHKYEWDIYVAERLPAELERIGFTNIQRKIYHVPIGFWPKEKKRMHHAFLYREVINEFLPSLRAKPFANGTTGLTPEELDQLFAEVRAATCNKRVHAYLPLHFVWAQKPGGTAG